MPPSSFSTESGILTFGDWSCRIFTLLAISLSCGWAAAITVSGFLVVLVDVGACDEELGWYVDGSRGRTRVGGGTAWPFFGGNPITWGRIVRFGAGSSRTVPGKTSSLSSTSVQSN